MRLPGQPTGCRWQCRKRKACGECARGQRGDEQPLTGSQRKEPVGVGGRTNGFRHQADVVFGQRRWAERQLYEVQLTSGCGWGSRCSDDCFPAARTGGTDPEPAAVVLISPP